jgi:hypothetical protein
MISLTSLVATERATNVAAAGAVVSPWWLDYLQPYSNIAATILPLLGCTWLALQMGTWLYNRLKKDK